MGAPSTRRAVEVTLGPRAEPVRPPGRLRGRWLAAALVLLGAAAGTALAVGPAGLPLRGVLSELVSALPGVEIGPGLEQRQADILWQIRMPRVALGALVGSTLALSGAAYQGVFRNPLADPYLLGVAAGAGLGATLAIAYFPDTSGWAIDALPLFAFVGAFAGVGFTWLVGRSARADHGVASLILAGVAVASFMTALQTFVQQRESQTLQRVYGWILGRLSTSGWDEVLLILPYVALSSAVLLAHRRLLDVLSVGDDEAGALGVDPARVRLVTVLAATLGTAAAVSVSGLIGFVGIIVPHTVRLLAGSSFRVVLPLSLLGGAAFVVFADLLARTVASPAELPIGVITAFFGAPFFAVVLGTSRRLTP